ncbi:YchJ family protein [Ramlibacter sp. MMS24-I3-19]|uniref:YchJ family protein n=1 Tax=Ramlibacter sp. MMS24-I3-19 TaxID=3416606 RepID=UPI003CFFFF66
MTPPACPCGRADARGRPRALAQCCGPLLAGQPAPDAELLMRSRYTAYVLGDVAYLRASWDPATCPADVMPDAATKWLGLEVRDHRLIDADHAEVEFVARYRIQGRGGRLHERSRFRRDAQGRWLYVDGSFPQGGP